MIVSSDTLAAIRTDFQAIFLEAYAGFVARWQEIATEFPSTGEFLDLSWLGAHPAMKEWVDQKVYEGLRRHRYAITNKDWEATLEVMRKAIEDDSLGLYKPRIQEMAIEGKRHPDELVSALQRVAEKKLAQLSALPPDAAGQIRSLREYEFMDQQAGQDFRDLLEMLEQGVLRSFEKEVKQRLESLTAEAKQRMKEMLRELNRMLRERSEGIDPDFAKFMQQFGDFFPSQPRSLEELVEHIQRQIAQLRSLLDSMTQACGRRSSRRSRRPSATTSSAPSWSGWRPALST